MRKHLFIISLILLTSCGFEHKPVFLRFGGDQVSEDHDPDFVQGWDDGCETGSAVYGNHFTKAFKGFKRDTTKVGNPAYESAWYDAYHFCRQSHNTNINNWESDWWGILTLQ